MPIRRITVVAIAVAALSLLGCASTSPPSSSGSSGSSASPPAPPPSASARTVSIPTDCHQIVSPSLYSATFGDTPLNDPAFSQSGNGAITPTQPAAGAPAEDVLQAATSLDCLWADPQADITQFGLTMGKVDPVLAGTFLDTLPATGYKCDSLYGGRQCQLIKRNEQYPVDEGYTVFLRDNIFIRVVQVNVPTVGFLGKVVETLWG